MASVLLRGDAPDRFLQRCLWSLAMRGGQQINRIVSLAPLSASVRAQFCTSFLFEEVTEEPPSGHYLVINRRTLLWGELPPLREDASFLLTVHTLPARLTDHLDAYGCDLTETMVQMARKNPYQTSFYHPHAVELGWYCLERGMAQSTCPFAGEAVLQGK